MMFALIPQGILLVYDITNGWSFDGIDRWIREIDEVIPKKYRKWLYVLCHCPSIPAKDHCLLVSLEILF